MFFPVKRLHKTLLTIKSLVRRQTYFIDAKCCDIYNQATLSCLTKFVILHPSAEQKSRAMRVCITHVILCRDYFGWLVILLRLHQFAFQKRLHFIFPRISDDGFQNFENFGSIRSWKLSKRDFWKNKKYHSPGGPFCCVK